MLLLSTTSAPLYNTPNTFAKHTFVATCKTMNTKQHSSLLFVALFLCVWAAASHLTAVVAVTEAPTCTKEPLAGDEFWSAPPPTLNAHQLFAGGAGSDPDQPQSTIEIEALDYAWSHRSFLQAELRLETVNGTDCVVIVPASQFSNETDCVTLLMVHRASVPVAAVVQSCPTMATKIESLASGASGTRTTTTVGITVVVADQATTSSTGDDDDDMWGLWKDKFQAPTLATSTRSLDILLRQTTTSLVSWAADVDTIVHEVVTEYTIIDTPAGLSTIGDFMPFTPPTQVVRTVLEITHPAFITLSTTAAVTGPTEEAAHATVVTNHGHASTGCRTGDCIISTVVLEVTLRCYDTTGVGTYTIPVSAECADASVIGADAHKQCQQSSLGTEPVNMPVKVTLDNAPPPYECSNVTVYSPRPPQLYVHLSSRVTVLALDAMSFTDVVLALGCLD